ncbi:hypothetical protein EVAR_22914_1 [Eumeta japonica]|uniref:Uncharacterized protein n=1 Tax=Eumeta variegata TaxID=151549 RepID=A0A4C1UU38_EUMVA|nr:hypothetical protein EVAR_22914_1 [Eumeta japonica]
MAGALSPTPAVGDDESSRRRSVFYVPLFESFDNYLPLTPEEKEALVSGRKIGNLTMRSRKRYCSDVSRLRSPHPADSSHTESESDISVFGVERRFRRPLSTALSSSETLVKAEESQDLTSPRLVAQSGLLRKARPRLRSSTSCEPRYDRVYNPLGSTSSSKLNDSRTSIGPKTSAKMAILNSNLSLIPDSPKLMTPNKEKSRTLPQNPKYTVADQEQQ